MSFEKAKKFLDNKGFGDRVKVFDVSSATVELAAAAIGADGIMIEVHNDPEHALCDGAQSLTPAQFDDVSRRVRAIREAL